MGGERGYDTVNIRITTFQEEYVLERGLLDDIEGANNRNLDVSTRRRLWAQTEDKMQ